MSYTHTLTHSTHLELVAAPGKTESSPHHQISLEENNHITRDSEHANVMSTQVHSVTGPVWLASSCCSLETNDDSSSSLPSTVTDTV